MDPTSVHSVIQELKKESLAKAPEVAAGQSDFFVDKGTALRLPMTSKSFMEGCFGTCIMPFLPEPFTEKFCYCWSYDHSRYEVIDRSSFFPAA